MESVFFGYQLAARALDEWCETVRYSANRNCIALGASRASVKTGEERLAEKLEPEE